MRGANALSERRQRAREVNMLDPNQTQSKKQSGSSSSNKGYQSIYPDPFTVDMAVFPHPWIRFQWLFVILLFITGACQPSAERDTDTPSNTSYNDEGIDYFPDKVDVQYANHFSVSYHGHYKIVRTHADVKAWQSDDPPEYIEDVVVLVQAGTPRPEPENVYFDYYEKP